MRIFFPADCRLSRRWVIRSLSCLVAIVARAVVLPAQTPTPDANQRQTIRGIELHRAEVFDSTEARFWPYRVMNVLHAVTKPWVIRRELLFETGERFDTARVHESERNLRALGVFRDVHIDSVATDSGVIVRVYTADVWTTTPGIDVSSSGSQSTVSLSLSESNLLGTRTVGFVGYVSDPDRSSLQLGFDSPRALANRVGVGAGYIDRSDGRGGYVSARYPFFSLSSTHGGSIGAQFSNGRVLRFVGGDPRPIQSVHREYSLIHADAASALYAGPSGYLRVGIAAQVRREEFAPESSPTPLPDTITIAAGPVAQFRRAHFIQVRNVQSMDRVEDVDLGLHVESQLLVAPASWGYQRSGLGGAISLGVGARIPSGYLQLSIAGNGVKTSAGLDSGTVGTGITVVLQPQERWLLVAHAGGGAIKNPSPGGEFDVGLGYGVRAYPLHSFTGDRGYQMSFESRWIVWPQLFDVVGVGVAAFAEQAGAWYHGSPRRVGTDAGVGLRIASIREAGGVWRLDLAHRPANEILGAGWVLAIGRGFVFER